MQVVKRAAGYVRVSQVGGRSGESFLSPEVQREKIEAWAAYRGYTVVRWYVDLDVSGTGKVRRPEFERLMADARDHRFEVIAVYRLTRFARSVAGAAAAYSELEQLGVGLVSCTEDIDTTTVAGNLMRNILFALAEFESQRIGEEWRNVHTMRRRRGILHVTGPMLGYTTADGTIAGVEEGEAAAVRLAYTMRANGASYTTISDELLRQGFRPKWGAARFTQASLRKVLTNPAYAGLVRDDDELLLAVHPAIVTRELWDTVQSGHKTANRRAPYRTGLLAGLVVCSGCSQPMWSGTSGRRMRRAYRCSPHTRSHLCERPTTIDAEVLDEYVERLFLRRFDPRRMPRGGRVQMTRTQQTWTRRAARLRARADELTRALDAIADQRWVKGTMETSEYERQFLRYTRERESVLAEAEQVEEEVRKVRPIDQSALALWPGLEARVKRQAIGRFIESVVIAPADQSVPNHAKRAAIPKRATVNWLR